jgi:hypothetical protein
VAGAEVRLTDIARSAITDARGTFEFADVSAGRHRLTVRKVGFVRLDTALAIADGVTLKPEFLLTRISILDSMKVSRRMLPLSFEEHRYVGLGHFFTREDLSKLEGVSLPAVIGTVLGVKVIGQKGPHGYATSSRGVKSITNAGKGAKPCYMNVYLDGLLLYADRDPGGRMPEPLFDLGELSPDRLEAIEIYSGPASIPDMYNRLDTQCGVLVLWSRRTFPDSADKR